MSQVSVVKLRLALMGRPVRNYTFDKTQITVGRDPESDVFVDNPGVSRDHFRLERTDSGEYQVVDLGSANGTLLNDQKVTVARLRNNDVVRFGKYTLWVGYDHDRRFTQDDSRRASPTTEGHTLVLSRTELDSVIEASKVKEAHVDAPRVVAPVAAEVARVPAEPAPFAAVLVSFVLGALLGAGVVWLWLNR
jgi:pSer/pThr/pTyr-binding forkhead associated (FHA) protein